MILSICIPTYNRYPYLKELIEELLSQIKMGSLEQYVEIIISDNASTDDSNILFNELTTYSFIKIYRLAENKGADYNFYNVASNANGEYIWWFCSDDLPEPGALRNVLNVLQLSESNIFYLGHNLYSKDMQLCYGKHPYLEYFDQTSFHGVNGIINFGYMLGYIGAIIVRKKEFNKVVAPLKYAGTNYTHIAWVIELVLVHESYIELLPNSFIKHRLGNDSFLNNDYFKRAMIDVIGYKKIGKDFLSYKNFTKFYRKIFDFHLKGRFLTIASSSWAAYIKVAIVQLKHFWPYFIAINPVYLLRLFFLNPMKLLKSKITK